MPDRRDPNQPWSRPRSGGYSARDNGQPKPPPPPGPGAASTRGGYPAGDKPPSELKTPPASMIRLAPGPIPCASCGVDTMTIRCRCVTPWSTPAGRLVAGSVEPPHRCDPARIWADLGGKTRTVDDEEFPDADPSVRIECTCGERWEPVPPASWWSYGARYCDGWLCVVEPKPDEYPPPGLHPNREDIAREHPVSLRTFWRWITRA